MLLEFLSNGMTDERIGEQLHLSSETVRANIRKVVRSLGARNRAHAVALALKTGVIQYAEQPALGSRPGGTLREYRGAEPLGAAVKFQNNKVIAVFTLGSPAGWGVAGAMMGGPVSNVYNVYGTTGTKNCIGYDALTVRIGNDVTSFYSAAGVIYGFALTTATQTPCQ